MAIEGLSEDDAREPPGVLYAIIANVALAGGLLMLATAIMVCVSVSMRWATSHAIPGDFEMVQIAVALSGFAAFPYCQLKRSNIVVNTFTTWLPPAGQAWLDAFWDIVYAAVAAFLAWRLAVGASETIASGTTTMMAGIPIGWGIAVTAALVALLALTALTTAVLRVGKGARAA